MAEDLRVTVGADISQYKAAMQDASRTAQTASNNISQSLAEAAKETEVLGGATQSASMRFYTMRSGVSAARDGVMAFTLSGQAAERSLMAMGHHITSLVNETGSFKGAMSALASSLIGPGGIILGLTLAAELIGRFMDSQQKATETQTEYQKAVESANKSATEEAAKLMTLYTAATNANLPMSERLAAVRELQSEYPAYFANIDKEAILAGKAAAAYDSLTNAIINKAIVQAGQEKLQESIKPLVDLITEQRKLQVQIDEINAKRVASFKANQTPGFNSPEFGGPGFRTASTGGASLMGSFGNNINSQKAQLEKQIKDAQDSIQQTIQALGINSLIDPDKNFKTDKLKTGLDLLKEQLKDLKKELDDAVVDNKPGAYINSLAVDVQNLTDKIDKAEETIKNSMLMGKGATPLQISNAGIFSGFGKGELDNDVNAKGVGRLVLPNTLSNGGLGSDVDNVTQQMIKAAKAHKEYNDMIASSTIEQIKFDDEVKRANNYVHVFGTGLESVFEKSLAGTQNFVQGMIQFLEELIIKFIAAAAAAEFLNIVTGGSSAGFGNLFGQLSGLTNVFGGTSRGTAIDNTSPSSSISTPSLPTTLNVANLKTAGGLTDGQIVGKVSGPNLQLVFQRSGIQKDRLF